MASKGQEMELYGEEVQASVSFTSFMTAVSMFFVGLILTRYETFEATIRIPVLFLIVSTFGFLYSTLVYSNASDPITRMDRKRTREYMFIGDVISEYVGVYMLIFSLPLTITAITKDAFLQFAVLAASIMGLVLYSFSRYSIIYRQIGSVPRELFVVVMCAFEAVLFFAQAGSLPFFTELSIAFLALIMLFSYDMSRYKERRV
ncbi:MAG: hypothetical protein QXU82_00470 [Candidatus Aenigmatarchaeota archaeon]